LAVFVIFDATITKHWHIDMDAYLDRRFPSTADIERAALRRMPKFIRDYLFCGMGLGHAVRRNRSALDALRLMPRYLVDADKVDFATTLFGQNYDAPFGVAPVGMGGVAWPGAADSLATAANRHNLPFAAATFTTSSLENLHSQAQSCGWFQFYRPNIPEIEEDILRRAEATGYDVLIVTVDVPSPMRRDHDIRNGFSVPPRFSLRTGFELASCPAWSLAMARSGFPVFENIVPYMPAGLGTGAAMAFIADSVTGHITPEIVVELRARWPGTMVLKGILDPDEAMQCRDLGVDGIIISNHVGRQLEAAPTASQMLPLIRTAVGPDYPLIADGGVRTGLDICRMLALGADFVLVGRPFYYAVAAMGAKGADHIMQLFKAELRCTMGQLGCATLPELRDRLMSD
jgi:L-lactate dehydrogenase (cytochrome)